MWRPREQVEEKQLQDHRHCRKGRGQISDSVYLQPPKRPVVSTELIDYPKLSRSNHLDHSLWGSTSEKGNLRYNNEAIHIFGDLTAGEAKRTAAFKDMRKTLQNIAGVRFGFRHPTTFRITMPGKEQHRFADPQKAIDYVKSASSETTDSE